MTDGRSRHLFANCVLDTEVVTQGLEALTTAGFVAVDSDQGYRLEPVSPGMDDMAPAIADLYKRKPRAVMRAIFSAPKDRKPKPPRDTFGYEEEHILLNFEAIIYLVCVVTSLFCTWLLISAFHRHRQSLLLWSALCFGLLSINNLLVFTDLVVLPEIDLSPARSFTALTAGMLLLCGFIWGME